MLHARISRYVALVLGALEALAIRERVTALVGLSFGAAVCTLVAAQLPRPPTLVPRGRASGSANTEFCKVALWAWI